MDGGKYMQDYCELTLLHIHSCVGSSMEGLLMVSVAP